MARAAVGLYVLVALLCSSVVQSYLGAAVSAYFSKEWGGKVRIGALHFSPFSHAVLDKIELISPDNDTIFIGDRITCRFRSFPFSKKELDFDRVEIANARYHFLTEPREEGKHPRNNLSYIIDYFQERFGPSHKKPDATFTVKIDEVVIRNVDYIMDLPNPPGKPLLAAVADSLDHTPAPRAVSIPHMRWLDINGRFRNLKVVNDHVKVRIMTLSTVEAGGLEIKDISGNVEVSSSLISVQDMDLETASSHLLCDVRMDYDGWLSMADYCNNVWHDITLKPGSYANVSEAGWWAPALWGTDCPVTISGHCHGSIADFHVDSIQAAFGQGSHFKVAGLINGLPSIRNTLFDIDLPSFYLSLADMAQVSLPNGMDISPLLSRLRHLQYLSLSGHLKGSQSNAALRLDLGSGIGDVQMDVAVQPDGAKGHIHSDALGIHDIMPNEWLSRTGVDLTFEGHGSTLHNLCATLEGELHDTRIRQHDLEHTRISAQMADGIARLQSAISDSLLRCNINGTLNLDKKSGALDVNLAEARLSDLGLIAKTDSNIVIRTHLNASLKGDNIETLNGDLHLRNTRCDFGSRNLSLDQLDLTLAGSKEVPPCTSGNNEKDIHLSCDWFDLAINGYFDYANLPLVIDHFITTTLPITGSSHASPPSPLPDSRFTIDFQWSDPQGTFANFLPNYHIAQGTSLHGTYSYTESLKLVLRSDELSTSGVTLKDVGLSSSLLPSGYALRLQVASVSAGNMQLLNNLDANTHLSPRISTLGLVWHDPYAPTDSLSNLEFFLSSGRPQDERTQENATTTGFDPQPITKREVPLTLNVTRPDFWFLGQHWCLVSPEGIQISPTLSIPLAKLYGDGQSISLKSKIGGGSGGYLEAQFDGFALDRVGQLFLAKHNVTVDGIVNGSFDLHDIGGNPYFEANLDVEEFKVNDQSAGHLKIQSNREASEERINLNLSTEKHFPDRVSRPIEVNGSVMVDGSNNLDLNLSFHRVSLQTVGPLLTSFTSNIDGYLSGNFHIGGNPDALDLNGIAAVTDGLLHVDITGVTYYFSDSLSISNDTLTLNNFSIHDGEGNTARVNGHLIYSDNDLLLDLNLAAPRIQVLDSRSGETFYGRLLASAEGTLTGSIAHPAIHVRASTLEGSELHVPVDNKLQVSEGDYIHFVSYGPRPLRQSSNKAIKQSNLDLTLDLTVTPGLKLCLPMDFSEITADVEAVGTGDLHVGLSAGSQPSVLGTYQFSSGRFALSLLQLIDKTFAIEQGSSLSFPGNISDARFDIRAVYNQRVNLATLTGNTGSDAYAQVQNVIALAGTLDNPSLQFDIRLPNADQSTMDQVNALINLSNDRDMLNHTVSLLLLGRFANTTTSSESDGLIANGINSINVLASSMSSIITNAVKVVDVNFKVQQGAVAGSSQIDVGISKQWEKFYFESSFGYESANTTEQSSAEYSNILVGDMVVGYRIRPFFSFYGFHRTNTSYYTRSEIPYKQGVGLKWSKDFNTLSDLFKKQEIKK